MVIRNNKRIVTSIVLLATTCHLSSGFLQQCLGKHAVNHRRSVYYQQVDVAHIVSHTDECVSSSAEQPFTPWPKQEVVESEGDYLDEAYLEKHIGGQLYWNNNMKNLPQLPMPTLRDTVEKFLPTALPLCESEEEKRTLIDACDTFEEQARHLQARLMRRRNKFADSSWLQQWWNQLSYLQVRDPVAVHVSYFLSVDYDKTLPSQEELDEDTESTRYFGAKGPSVLRGAAAIISAAKVRKRVCSGQQACDKVGDQPLCSTGYKYLFHSTRIPRRESDTVKLYDPARNKHCIVAIKGYFFAVPFVDAQENPLPLGTLVQHLSKCQQMAEENEANVPKIGIGWLSGGCDRDFWAACRNKLSKYKSFREALAVLESGAFVICLDDVKPECRSESSKMFLRGVDGSNRFFDKSVNIIVNGLGQAALLGEHSMMDGSIPMLICNQMQKDKYSSRRIQCGRRTPGDINGNTGVRDIFKDCWEDPDLDLPEELLRLSEKGRKQYQELADSVELKTIVHDSYGKQLIKKAGVSPDAFIQMVLQLVAYRVFGKQIPTYEAAQTRKFIHGRTEVVRAVSMESRAFVEAMGGTVRAGIDDIDGKCKKLELLRVAAKAHHEHTVASCNGFGIDRHFLGLSLVLTEGEELPDLFKHPVFIRSQTWRLSTSSLPTCPGFGPVVNDGLGVGYALSGNSITFHISSSREMSHHLDKFCCEVSLAMEEMRGLFEAAIVA